MSLVGNITTNYDGSAQRSGFAAVGRRYSLSQDPALEANHYEKPTRTSSDDSSTVNGPTSHEVLEEHRIVALACQLSRSSTRNFGDHNLNPDDVLRPESGTIYDPFSESFDSRAWIKSMLAITSRDPEKYPRRTAGIGFKNLSVHGYASDVEYQQTVGNVLLSGLGNIRDAISGRKRKVQIINQFDGIIEAGEMLVVLGPPGSGCSTFLKTITGETHGIFVGEDSYINYQGITPKQMHNNFRGEAIYSAEQDIHFPQLTVGNTLGFAAEARAPREPPGGMKKHEYAQILRDVVMASLGISHTINTKVGNEYVRGVSGGERKRVSIAEAMLAGAPLQAWDNSTRGLDSANAIEFCKNLRGTTDIMGSTACVAIYQSPQAAYDYFDKVVLIYQGEQCFFGSTKKAKDFFVRMGFECPERQTVPDFLTSLTSPSERVVRPGWENKVPRTPEEFAAAWRASEEYAQLQRDLEKYDERFPIGGEALQAFQASRRAQQSKNLSYMGQIKICLRRGFWRLRADPSLTLFQLFGNFVMALIVSSVFFNLPADTSSFFSRGSLLFFAILLNAFGSALEILTLYAQRPIVEKHVRFAFYHASAEAFASMLTDMPYKILNSIIFNITLYFMTNLRREPGAFFFFYLISFFLTLTMSMFFRSIASLSRTLSQALAPAAILILALVIYTGFALPVTYMHGWSRWINYLDPIAYGFESLMINEFHGRDFPCVAFVPSYGTGLQRSCSTVGSVPGQDFVNGDIYINTAYAYYHSHKWRNFGILIAFMLALMALYLGATELISSKKSKGEVLVFPRTAMPKSRRAQANDEEAGNGNSVALTEKHAPHKEEEVAGIQRQTAIFHWENVVYDIKIKKEDRRILDHVSGWVKPGTLTCLMGVSGAGKTTLLDVLASRVTMGVIDGEMLVDGRPRDDSFQRKTGYVQQQDLHLSTSTVREALRFSALLRQPAKVPRKEKLAYVEEVIKLLEMESYANAVVGVLGEGLNVEQRKRLTIGVELVAKPELLLFLDEPTSGLDSQTSWAIIQLLQKLADHGQAILCTVHQPSAQLFSQFNRLLLLAKGGKQIYFGEVGQNSETLISYFERNGARPCGQDENPAEYMLNAIGATPGVKSTVDWHKTWLESPEYEDVKTELAQMKRDLPNKASTTDASQDKINHREFAASFSVQLLEVLRRVFQQWWRTPSYIWSKTALCAFSGLFIGFSFYDAGTSIQSLQNQLFSIFLLFTIFGQLVQQMMPHFVTQRDLYEVRERPSKTYSWKIFMISNIIVELPWNSLMAVLIFFTWYYPVGFYKNAGDDVNGRGILMFLLVWAFLLFTSTFTHLIISFNDTAENGGNIANLLFSLCLIFCGVLASKDTMPGFWIFMYRVSPFTYLASAMLSTGVGNARVVCSAVEYVKFQPPTGQTCQQWVAAYQNAAGGYLQNPDATADCSFCPASSTDAVLATFNVLYSERWRNLGILFAFIIFNAFAAVGLYWLARVPKNPRRMKKHKKTKKE
ncbi:ABC multidrug transporter afr2 [Naganishia adeliensis]|uniref:ABC multidrug transporter afr2 n=1 Tax=Naganishia adeliensis TaxID=92952 RepID=A0ACC2WPQ4_9TREE|nr:ABC multidrug transporter afr2 [Naganishia adeliensis]